MEKKQSELCLEILRRFHRAGILNDLILIGSWCVYFYEDYFSGSPHINPAAIRTRDMDFLIADPAKIRRAVNVPELVKDLGFLIDYKGSKGYIRLDHPDLILEFLVPEKGRGSDKPCEIERLGINATSLRFLNFLTFSTIRIKVDDFRITVPHPAVFALHKLIIYQRRAKEEKAEKDLRTAVSILQALIEKGELRTIRRIFDEIPGKWQAKVTHGLDLAGETEILTELTRKT